MNGRPAILLVDDDENHLLVARRAIERANLHAQVHVARDGMEALRVLGLEEDDADEGPSFRLVVIMLDLTMPILNGWQVLERIRKARTTREIPVVVVSSSARPDDIRRSYLLGANSFLVKRYEAKSPGKYLAEAARYWVELNELPRPPKGALL